MNRLSELFVGMDMPKQGIPGQGPDCDACGDTRWKRVNGGVVRCPECWERQRGFAPGVPDDEAKACLDAYSQGEYTVSSDNRAAIEHGRYFVRGVHPGLYIHGGVGTGKTTLACAILNDLHRAGTSVRFARVTEVLNGLAQHGDDDARQQLLARLVKVPVLVLDDIGAQKGTDYAKAALLMIYEGRTDKGHRTIWTSNLGMDELVEFFGDDERLTSRIIGNAKIVELDGDDYRLRKARRRK